MQEHIGQNITVEVKGDLLEIKIDLSKRLGRSKSGKSTIIATTGGNTPIPGTDGAVLGLNLYTRE